MGRRRVSDEQAAVLRAALLDVARAGSWYPEGAAELVDVALRADRFGEYLLTVAPEPGR
ncbi:hypothetical protein [Micromonospora sp. NPDC049282]|uniref:hypothetical protein n=1 Tax=Micromonospora sp. NPDC049282 TaxID=3364269 RepID=UPI0037162BEE